LRKTMLTFQFTLAITVFISALTVSRQVSYVFSKDIGYNKDQILVITAFPKQWDSAGVNKMIDIKNALLQVPAVRDASLSFEIPDRRPPNSTDMQPVNADGRTVLVSSCGVDEHYASTYGLTVLSGSCFSQSGAHIPSQIVLNESAVKALGLTIQSAVNRQINVPSAPGTILTVAGVVKDFNYSSLQEKIEPIALFNVRDWLGYRYISLKLTTATIAETITRIKDKWKELSPGAPFEYTFMDE